MTGPGLIDILLSRRPRGLGVPFEREAAFDRSALTDGGIERHGAAVQFDKGTHDRQAEAGATVARALRMRFEPVEHAVLYFGRDAGAVVGDREHDRIGPPPGGHG